MLKKKTFKITDLSKHLFWDVDAGTLDPEKSKRLIISRVMDYGVMDDWKTIYNYYGIETIAQTLKSVKDLSLPAASLVSLLSGVPVDQFLCYTTKQSNQK
ncbi:MAG: DUF6922 domain-containing protein [Bacteroidota bacterium]